MSQLWINGQLVDKADAKVSPFDHGFLYGDGVWEHLRAFGGKLFRPHEHLGLLFQAAETLGITIPLSRDELLAAVETTLKANDRTDGYIRVIVTRGPGTIGPDPRKLDPQVIIIAEEYQPFPQELYGHGLHAVTADYPHDVEHPTSRLRLLGRPAVTLAKAHALRNGCLEAVLAAPHAVIGATEGTLFRIESGHKRVWWHAELAPPDPAADAAAALVEEAGCRVDQAWLAPGALAHGDEMFVAGTACGVIGIVRLDGTDIGTGTEGPLTKRVRERFRELVRKG